MHLCANAVELVFDKELIRHRAFDVCEIRCRRREHELQRMKEAHLDIVQSAIARAHRCFAEIAAQHVRHRDLRERLLECAGNRVFYQTFAQTDAQIAG